VKNRYFKLGKFEIGITGYDVVTWKDLFEFSRTKCRCCDPCLKSISISIFYMLWEGK